MSLLSSTWLSSHLALAEIHWSHLKLQAAPAIDEEGRIKSWQLLLFCKIDRSWRNMETYKWKCMVLGALGCMNNADFEKKLVNDNIVLDVFVIC